MADAPGGSERVRDLQREVEGVKSIMSQNVERILARGENLEHLRNKTEDLEATVRGHRGHRGDIAGTRVCGSRGGFRGPYVATRSPRWHWDPRWGWARGTWGAPGVAPWPQGSPRWHQVPEVALCPHGSPRWHQGLRRIPDVSGATGS
uniref:V-SNARE coiled-coil homology domain-containing protein n=1 Tax=Anas platyrhynchos TaxID=8839 RepID=A0A8B9Z7G1_ANAPL